MTSYHQIHCIVQCRKLRPPYRRYDCVYLSQIKVQPRRLYILVGCLLLVDVAFLITWQIMDPLYRDIESFPLEDPPNSHEDMKFKPLLEHCYCKNLTTWLGERPVMESDSMHNGARADLQTIVAGDLTVFCCKTVASTSPLCKVPTYKIG